MVREPPDWERSVRDHLPADERLRRIGGLLVKAIYLAAEVHEDSPIGEEHAVLAAPASRRGGLRSSASGVSAPPGLGREGRAA